MRYLEHEAEPMLRASYGEAIGRRLSDTIIPPHFRELHERGLVHYLATGEGPVLNKRIELAAIDRDGREFPVELSIAPVGSGSSLTFHAFLHDISDRKEADAALRQSEMQLRRSRRRLEQAQAIAHMGSWEWDVRANKVTWTDELYRIYGLTPDGFHATFEGYLERIHPEDRERVQATIARALADHRPFVFEEFSPHLKHVGLRASSPAWCKENVLNILVHRTPQANYICWQDADVFWEKPSWAAETSLSEPSRRPIGVRAPATMTDLCRSDSDM